MAISNRLNKAELSGFLVQEELITTGDLVSDNLGTGGLLTVGEKGVDGFSPIVTISYIYGSESSTGLSGYNINITDINSPYYGQDFQIYNGNGISSTVLNEDYSLTITFDDGSNYTTPSIRGDTGNGIEKIEKTDSYYNSEGKLIEEFTITFTDGNTFVYYIENGLSSADYNILENKPIINNVELQGNLELSDLNIQEKLTSENAGDGIEITRDQNGKVTISNTNVSAEWGNIQGDITDQTDLINYIDQNGGKIDTIKVNDVTQAVTNKTVNITVPTKTSDLINDSGFITNSVDNLINYYTKPEVDDLISGAGTRYTAGNGIDITNDVISLKNLILDCGTSTTVV